MVLSIPENYSHKHLNRHRVLPVMSKHILHLIISLRKKGFNPVEQNFPMIVDGEDIYDKFKNKFEQHLINSNLNLIQGLEGFAHKDIILGCTQYIDNIYISNKAVQVIENDYKYHERLGVANIVELNNLKSDIPLIVSMPFVNQDKVIYSRLFDECYASNIPVHVDCAWVTASTNLVVDLTHPAINSVGFSMSKGYGTGFNRAGVRYCREKPKDSISLQNDFQMVPTITMQVALYFLENILPDHLWNTHGKNYYTLCKDFNLTPSSSIHQAYDGNYVVGTAELLHYMEYHNV